MTKIKDILGNDFTMKEFWAIVDALPDDINSKNYKLNINAYFKKSGDLKVKALSLSTEEDYQIWHDMQGFIRRGIRTQIHLNKLRHHVAVHKQHIKDVKEGKVKRHKVVKYGKLEPIKRNKKDKITQQEIEKIDPIALRNQLVVEYNRLIREGNPDTKKLREQIHEQIQKIEGD